MPFDPLNPGQMGTSGSSDRKPAAPRRPASGQAPRRNPAPAGRMPGRTPGQTPGRDPASAGRNPQGRPPRPTASRPAAPERTRQRPDTRQRTSQPAGAYQPKFAAKGSKARKNPLQKLNPGTLTLIALLLVGSLTMVGLSIHLVNSPGEPGTPAEIPDIPALETRLPELPHVVSEATITVTGDLLPHKPLYNKGTAIYKDDQDYDFDPVFKYLKGYVDTADYAIANLETSLYGPGKPYSGNPKLNTPDQIVDGAKKAGFDMLLTANNHCNDTGFDGVIRTVEVVEDRGLEVLGTRKDPEKAPYHIEDLNGIRVGMMCYTYEDSQDPRVVTFNYNPLPKGKEKHVSSFPLFEKAKSRDAFYEEIAENIAQMKKKGADQIVLFLHWGNEYHLEASEDQKSMAQRLCDLGVDVIVGGHPHVVEPVELLTSTQDPEHKMVCLYSLGNAVSNQRREAMTSQKSGHTEDGMLFLLKFQKYSDDSVYLSKVDVIPTWVNMYENSQKLREYNILPLAFDNREQWQNQFSLDDPTFQKAVDSYNRTMDIVGPGVANSNGWLREQLPHREEPTQETAVMEEDK